MVTEFGGGEQTRLIYETVFSQHSLQSLRKGTKFVKGKFHRQKSHPQWAIAIGCCVAFCLLASLFSIFIRLFLTKSMWNHTNTYMDGVEDLVHVLNLYYTY